MKRSLSVVAAALLVAAGGTVTMTGASAATSHCDGHQTMTKVEVPKGATGTTQTVTVDGELITVTVTGDDVTFTDADGNPVSVDFCLKAGTGTSDGTGDSGSSGSQYGPGKGISYVVLYGLEDVYYPS